MSGELREILLINPNTNPDTTAMLGSIAAEGLRARDNDADLVIRAVTVAVGPSVIVDPAGLDAAETAVLDCARLAVRPHTAGIIIGAIGDPGVEVLRRESTVPVVGIGEASARVAAAGGRRFGIVTTTPLLAGSLQALAERYGAAGHFTGVRLTDSSAPTLAADPDRQLRELERACRLCRETDGAEAVVIGGGPLGASARALAASLGMTVVQPVPAAVEQLVNLIRSATLHRVL
ncbi:hypothetical protein HQQ80_11130 [Microbacteriaceae bacterium VKM Ac-2855]|nr:hypothetical protein [Microbacteriaceae bacterium VKM Ac-2855]